MKNIKSGPFHVRYFEHGTADLTVDDDGFGIIDKTAQDCFTMGQCHSLALALHAETGWPLELWRDTDSWFAEWTHITVAHPDGGHIDINGWWRKDRTRYGVPEPSTAAQVRRLPGHFPIRTRAAKPFVRTLLRSLNQSETT